MKYRINFLIFFVSSFIPFALIMATLLPQHIQTKVLIVCGLIVVLVIFPYHFLRIRRLKNSGLENPNFLWIKKHPGIAISYTIFFLLALGHILYRSQYYSHPEAKALYEKYKKERDLGGRTNDAEK